MAQDKNKGASLLSTLVCVGIVSLTMLFLPKYIRNAKSITQVLVAKKDALSLKAHIISQMSCASLIFSQQCQTSPDDVNLGKKNGEPLTNSVEELFGVSIRAQCKTLADHVEVGIYKKEEDGSEAAIFNTPIICQLPEVTMDCAYGCRRNINYLFAGEDYRTHHVIDPNWMGQSLPHFDVITANQLCRQMGYQSMKAMTMNQFTTPYNNFISYYNKAEDEWYKVEATPVNNWIRSLTCLRAIID